MGVKLEAFVKLFDEKSNDAISKQKDRVSKKESQVEEFVKLRDAAISAATEFGTEEDIKIISETFPESGGMNNDKFRIYTNELFGGSFEEEIRALFKRRNAIPQLDGAKKSLARYESLKEAGGQSWFNQYMKAVGSLIAKSTSLGVMTPEKMFAEFFPGEFNEDNQEDIAMNLDYNSYPDPPRGVQSSIELYEAAKESGNPLNKKDDSVEEEVEEIKEVVVPDPPEEEPIEEKVKDILNEDAIEQEEEKAIDEEEFGPIETPINETEDNKSGGISKVIEPSINTKDSPPRKIVKVGSKGEDVEFLQKALGIEADGKFGPQTKKAVIAFQKANGLDQDGIVGPKTWSAVGKLENVETSSKIEASTPELQSLDSLPIEVLEETEASPDAQATSSVINEGESITNIENTNIEGETTIQTINEGPIESGQSFEAGGSSEGLGGNVDILKPSGYDTSSAIESFLPEVSSMDTPNISKEVLNEENISSAINNSNIVNNLNSYGDTISEGSTSLLNPSINESISDFSSQILAGDVAGAISNSLTNSSNVTSNTAESFVSGGTSGILDSIKDTSSITNNNSVEVNKETTGLDKSFAPLATSNQVSNTENKSMSDVSNSSESSSSMSNIDNSKTRVDNSTDSSTTSDTSNSKSNSMVSNNFDTSALELRLRRIENLLVGPLDVKIIET